MTDWNKGENRISVNVSKITKLRLLDMVGMFPGANSQRSVLEFIINNVYESICEEDNNVFINKRNMN